MITGFLHIVAFHTSFPVYVGGIIFLIVAVAAVYVRSLVKVLVRLRNSAITGAAVATALVLYVGTVRHAALVKQAAEWGHGPTTLLAYGAGDTFVIVTAVTFAVLMFRKKARKAAAAARNGGTRSQRRPVRAGGRA